MAFKKFTRSAAQLIPDPKFGSRVVSKFINCLMWDGKKTTASRAFYNAMDIVEKRVKDAPPLEIFETAVSNVKPNIQVRSRRVGGSNYQVPMPVSKKRQQALALRWMIQAVRGKKGKPVAQFLAQEIMDAYRGEGAAMTARNNVHRMADANKAFAHFAW